MNMENKMPINYIYQHCKDLDQKEKVVKTETAKKNVEKSKKTKKI
jgi:hypothetical protein